MGETDIGKNDRCGSEELIFDDTAVEESSIASKTESEISESPQVSTCEICLTIFKGLSHRGDSEEVPRIDLGTYEEALSSTCPIHGLLVKVTDYYRRKWTSHLYGLDSPSAVTTRFDAYGCLTVLHHIDSHESSWPSYKLYSFKGRETNDGTIARNLLSSWFDTKMVPFWLRECQMKHDDCGNSMAVPQIRPAWLVDTVRKCLVRGQTCESFVALSYRWGPNARRLHFDEDMLSLLQKPHAFENPEISSQIAPLVHQAIQLSALVGQRHIWVDALCINHSNPEESSRELQRMGAIYANAIFTMVVMDTDAEQGIPGIRDISSPMDRRYDIIPFGGLHLSHLPRTTKFFNQAIYHHRAWTHQEYYLSRRKLIVRKNSLHWQCQSRQWDGNLFNELVGYPETYPLYDDLYSSLLPLIHGIPDLITLQIMITQYNERKLTYAEDALPGITGLLTLLNRGLEGGFLCGIPVMFFETALMWYATDFEHRHRCNLKRRVFSGRSEASRLKPFHLPSWSWVGWEGHVWIDRSEIVGTRRHGLAHVSETHSVTIWYSCDSPTAQNRHRIRSSWIENRGIYTNPDKTMPDGWSREEVPLSHKSTNGFEEFLSERNCAEWYYRHKSTPEIVWYWPFPVRSVEESTAPDMPEQWPYICCNTNRARLHGFRSSMLQSGTGGPICLFNSDGQHVGRFNLHNEDEKLNFPFIEDGWHRSKEVEAVAICRKVHGVPPHPGRRPKSRETYKTRETYGILSIEWIDGVAYRLASGEIDRAAWEALELEDIFLVLG